MLQSTTEHPRFRGLIRTLHSLENGYSSTVRSATTIATSSTQIGPNNTTISKMSALNEPFCNPIQIRLPLSVTPDSFFYLLAVIYAASYRFQWTDRRSAPCQPLKAKETEGEQSISISY